MAFQCNLGAGNRVQDFRKPCLLAVKGVDPSGKVDMMISQMQLPGNPNGIAFGPDYKKLYVVTNGIVHSFELDTNNKLSNQKQFSDFMIDGVQCRTDGIRADINGNLCGLSPVQRFTATS